MKDLSRHPLMIVELCSLLALSVLLIACNSGSTISEEDARQVYTKTYGLNGIAKINSFHKTNGMASEQFGVKMYEFDYSAELEMTNPRPDLGWTSPVGTVWTDKGSKTLWKTEKGWKDKDGNIYSF